MEPRGAQRTRIDRDQATETTAILGAVATGREVDRAHEIGGEDGAQTASVVEQRHVDAVDVHARVLRRSAPDHQLPGPERCAGYARQVLDDLQRVALRTRHAPAFFGFDLGRDYFLLNLGRDDHDLEVRFLAFRNLLLRLEGILHRQLLTLLELLFGGDSGQIRAADGDDMLTERHLLELEVAVLVSHYFAAAIDGDGHARNHLLGEAIFDLTVEVDHRRGRLDLEHELVAIGDFDGRWLVVDFGRFEQELLHGLERGGVERGARLFNDCRIDDLAFVVDGNLQDHRCGLAGFLLRVRIGRFFEVHELR